MSHHYKRKLHQVQKYSLLNKNWTQRYGMFSGINKMHQNTILKIQLFFWEGAQPFPCYTADVGNQHHQ